MKLVLIKHISLIIPATYEKPRNDGDVSSSRAYQMQTQPKQSLTGEINMKNGFKQISGHKMRKEKHKTTKTYLIPMGPILFQSTRRRTSWNDGKCGEMRVDCPFCVEWRRACRRIPDISRSSTTTQRPRSYEKFQHFYLIRGNSFEDEILIAQFLEVFAYEFHVTRRNS